MQLIKMLDDVSDSLKKYLVSLKMKMEDSDAASSRDAEEPSTKQAVRAPAKTDPELKDRQVVLHSHGIQGKSNAVAVQKRKKKQYQTVSGDARKILKRIRQTESARSDTDNLGTRGMLK